MQPTVVIGAGFGGLAAALALAGAGRPVLVLEAAPTVGGKARQVATAAGPADAGPTVLTQAHVFAELFRDAGMGLDDFVRLEREPLLARHFWTDGSVLDLWDDTERSAAAVRAWAGSAAEADFRAVDAEARRLWAAFEAPVVRAARPRRAALAAAALGAPRLLPALAQSLATRLSRLSEPRLAQLFGRYATYVGGRPDASPALLALIWRAEAAGVWRVKGGLATLARALADAVEHLGGEVRSDAPVAEILIAAGKVAGVRLGDGTRIAADTVVFAGEPAALAGGLLGDAARAAVAPAAVAPPSLSARVWTFAARPRGPDLAHHNVFFGDAPAAEFGPIARGRPPDDPTLYVCAQDRGAGLAATAVERFEIIENAAPWDGAASEDPACRTRLITSLNRFGLSFDPLPEATAMTGPRDFARLFPGSRGSLYGRSPHGLTAALRRPTAQSRIAGLYLAGGGCHPGAGVPMAALSGRHAAAAILSGPALPSTSRRRATAGGTSTASPTTAGARSASSPS